MAELVAELPPGDPVGPFELASAYDSTGDPARAVDGYRQALDAGLAGPRRRRAVIQLASSLRNLGQVEESVALLTAERDAGSDDLDDAVRPRSWPSPWPAPAGTGRPPRSRWPRSRRTSAATPARWPRTPRCSRVRRGRHLVRPVGRVESPLTDRAAAPKQGDEGAPDCTIAFEPGLAEAYRDIAPGAELIVLTWLDRADRGVLSVHPRGDATRPVTGVFSTRSPDRPNPIGLHRVTVLAVDGARLRVGGLEALDGTPVLDVKPVLGGVAER